MNIHPTYFPIYLYFNTFYKLCKYWQVLFFYFIFSLITVVRVYKKMLKITHLV